MSLYKMVGGSALFDYAWISKDVTTSLELWQVVSAFSGTCPTQEQAEAFIAGLRAHVTHNMRWGLRLHDKCQDELETALERACNTLIALGVEKEQAHATIHAAWKENEKDHLRRQTKICFPDWKSENK